VVIQRDRVYCKEQEWSVAALLVKSRDRKTIIHESGVDQSICLAGYDRVGIANGLNNAIHQILMRTSSQYSGIVSQHRGETQSLLVMLEYKGNE
jgi:hypothetical protein